jgi:hypothetical protein
MGFSPGQALNRLFSFGAPWAQQQQQGGFSPPPTPQAPAPSAEAESEPQQAEPGASAGSKDDVATLRREIDELKDILRAVAKDRSGEE